MNGRWRSKIRRTSPPKDPWVCGYCHEHYPVPSLAEDCELAHEKEWGL